MSHLPTSPDNQLDKGYTISYEYDEEPSKTGFLVPQQRDNTDRILARIDTYRISNVTQVLIEERETTTGSM